MTAYRRGDGSWRYRFQLAGRRYYGRPRINTRAAAEAAEAEHRFRLLNPGAVLRPERQEVPSFGEFVEEFMASYVAANNKDSEQYGKRKTLNLHILPRLGPLPIDQVRTREIERLKAELLTGMTRRKKPRSRKTVNNILGVLSKVLRYAEEVEVLAKAPRVRLLKVEARSFDFLDFEAYGKLLGQLEHEDPQWRIAVLLGGDAGLRLGEIRALGRGHWSRKTGRLEVLRAFWLAKEGPTKGWNRRSIPLTARLASALGEHRHLRKYVLCDLDGQALTMETMRWNLPRICKAAGIRPIGWHALRHTFCSHLAMRGAPARTIQELAGHSSLSTTLQYMHLVPGAKEDAIALLNRGGAEVVQRAP